MANELESGRPGGAAHQAALGRLVAWAAQHAPDRGYTRAQLSASISYQFAAVRAGQQLDATLSGTTTGRVTPPRAVRTAEGYHTTVSYESGSVRGVPGGTLYLHLITEGLPELWEIEDAIAQRLRDLAGKYETEQDAELDISEIKIIAVERG